MSKRNKVRLRRMFRKANSIMSELGSAAAYSLRR